MTDIDIDIEITKYNNAVAYRMKNKRVTIVKIDEDAFNIETKIFLILDDKEKQDYIACDSPGTIFIHRPHSKFCVWHNQIRFSRIALECIFTFANDVDQLKVSKDEH